MLKSLRVLLPVAALTAVLVPGLAQAQPTDVFISEYIEGSSNNKAIEIYNGTGAAINLATGNYVLQQYFNGSASSGLNINLTGTVAAGDVYVVAQASASATILAQADQTSSSGFFNGDDAIVLRKGGTGGAIVDSIGQIGTDPGTEWGTGLTSTADNTLRRKTAVCQGDTNASDAFNPATEWEGFATDTFGGLGSHTATCGGGVTLSIDDVSAAEGNSGTTTFTFTVSLSAPAGAGGVSFDIATADNSATVADNDYATSSLTGQTIPAGSSTYTFDVTVNGDTTVEPNQTFFVNVTNVTGANAGDTQGQGTITNDDVALVFIHDVQGNGAATPIPAATVSVEGVVIGDYQAGTELQGFFLQEEDADADADPLTSEGIFIFCSSCPTAVAEGQRVRVTGAVSEFFNMTEITASTAGSVVVTDAGNNLAQVTPAPVDLPVAGDVNAFYETREGMLVTFVDTLTVSEYFELFRFGQIELYEGGRPRQFTEIAPPNAAGYTAHLDNLDRRRVILDDDDNTPNVPLNLADGSQLVFHPQANGGFSVGTQGTDFFRGGDLVNGLTGVLHWSFAGSGSVDAWRIRPTAATPATFTVANPRPATAPAVSGAIKAASMNLLNYFTTIDTTSSSSSGPCGPSGTLDCRGADNVAELDRQRERASIVICGLNADVFGFMELENTTPTDTINDLLGAVNARCGGANPYAFVDTGGTLGTDAIRVALIYRSATLSPVGSPLVDLDPVHNRPPTAQTFDVADPLNPAFGERFTVIANHFKSKGCPGTGADADAGDGAGCFNGARTAQASRLLTWISGTVLPAAGDPDVLLLGDFNSYAQEPPVTTLTGGGFTDLESALLGPNAYSYLFDGQLGHLDYAFSSTSLTPQVTGVGAWHINADEVPLFDYSDEIKDTGEATFEEKPDGSALVPPRVVFQPASPFRASDHDPVLVGLFAVADLSITKVESADPVTTGTNLAYTITVDNAGPDPAAGVSWSDTLPAGTTFVSLAEPGGWSCTTPAVGAGGTVSCSIDPLGVGSAVFTLTVLVDASVVGTDLSNTATVTSTTDDPDSGDISATETTTVAATSADLSITKVDTPDPVTPGTDLTYTITVANAGPDAALSVLLSDTLPAGTTFVSLSAPGGWSCTTPAVGAGGTVSCSLGSFAVGSAVFTLVVHVDPSVPPGTEITNSAGASSATADPEPENEIGIATTIVAGSADLSVTQVDTPDPVAAGANLAYTITVTNAGPNYAGGAILDDPLPAGTTFQSLSAPAGWSCSTPAVGAAGNVSCSTGSFAPGSAMFTLTVAVGSGVANGTVLTNTAAITSPTPDLNTGNESASATTTVTNSTVITATKTAGGQLTPGGAVTYTVVLTNTSGQDQADNPGAEFTDVLPAQLILVSATATSGTAVATVATNTVTWNGPIPGGGSVTITINATVASGIANGTSVSNQGSVAYDADGNGTNEASAVTDDPAAGGTANPTTFIVGGQSAVEIPTLNEIGLALLVLLLALGGAGLLRCRA